MDISELLKSFNTNPQIEKGRNVSLVPSDLALLSRIMHQTRAMDRNGLHQEGESYRLQIAGMVAQEKPYQGDKLTGEFVPERIYRQLFGRLVAKGYLSDVPEFERVVDDDGSKLYLVLNRQDMAAVSRALAECRQVGGKGYVRT